MKLSYLPPMTLVITLLACSGPRLNQNIDPSRSNPITYRQDLRECQEDYPEVDSGVYLKERMGCMSLKGWR